MLVSGMVRRTNKNLTSRRLGHKEASKLMTKPGGVEGRQDINGGTSHHDSPEHFHPCKKEVPFGNPPFSRVPVLNSGGVRFFFLKSDLFIPPKKTSP